MYHPRISIIIPTLNQGKFIKQTLESIISQDYPNIEIIVMDGGSRDGTIEILKSFDKRLKINDASFSKASECKQKSKISFKWESKKDKGQADAINKGLRLAKGDIVAYINSDDFYYPQTFKIVAKYFILHPKTMWTSGDYRIVDGFGKTIHEPIRWYKKIFRMLPLSFVLPVLNPIAQPSTFWRRKVFERVGFFDESLLYTFDYDYWFRILQRYPLTALPDILSAFRIHGESKGGRTYKKQFEEEMEVVKRYTKNPFFLFLHRIHNAMIVGVYNRIKNT